MFLRCLSHTAHCWNAFGPCFDPPPWCPPPVSYYSGLWMLAVLFNKRVLPWWFGEEAGLVVWPWRRFGVPLVQEISTPLPAVSERQTSTHLESQWENGAFSSQGESEYWSTKQNPIALLCREEFPISSLMFVFKIHHRFKSHLWKMKCKVQQYSTDKKRK